MGATSITPPRDRGGVREDDPVAQLQQLHRRLLLLLVLRHMEATCERLPGRGKVVTRGTLSVPPSLLDTKGNKKHNTRIMENKVRYFISSQPKTITIKSARNTGSKRLP